MAKSASDDGLTGEILMLLKRLGIPAARTHAGSVRIFGNRHMRLAPPGWPDIVTCLGGRFVGIECKARGKTLSPPQIAMRKLIEDSGGLYYVATRETPFQDWILSTRQAEEVQLRRGQEDRRRVGEDGNYTGEDSGTQARGSNRRLPGTSKKGRDTK